MKCETIEQDFRAAEDYAKVRHIKPAAMNLFLDDLQDLETETKTEDITAIVQKVIKESRFDPLCDMKPLTIFQKVVQIVDPLKFSHWWAD
ncbi:hypothetical protein [Succinimonas sp.]|uniref:hypothetical protein n=1 Tax=Succinimonas sp. TaxID=1936151 RepID=UPI0038667BD1